MNRQETIARREALRVLAEYVEPDALRPANESGGGMSPRGAALQHDAKRRKEVIEQVLDRHYPIPESGAKVIFGIDPGNPAGSFSAVQMGKTASFAAIEARIAEAIKAKHDRLDADFMAEFREQADREAIREKVARDAAAAEQSKRRERLQRGAGLDNLGRTWLYRPTVQPLMRERDVRFVAERIGRRISNYDEIFRYAVLIPYP